MWVNIKLKKQEGNGNEKHVISTDNERDGAKTKHLKTAGEVGREICRR